MRSRTRCMPDVCLRLRPPLIEGMHIHVSGVQSGFTAGAFSLIAARLGGPINRPHALFWEMASRLLRQSSHQAAGYCPLFLHPPIRQDKIRSCPFFSRQTARPEAVYLEPHSRWGRVAVIPASQGGLMVSPGCYVR